MNKEQAAEIRNEYFEAQRHLRDYKAHHASPRGYWESQRAAEARLNAAEARLNAAHLCEYGAGRIGGDEPCTCTQTQRYDAGAYGSLVLCEKHADIAMALHNEAVDAMEESGRALAQMLSDERAMMRS